MAKNFGDEKLISMVLLGFGTFYCEKYNYNQALRFFEQSLKIAEKRDIKDFKAQALANIGIDIC